MNSCTRFRLICENDRGVDKIPTNEVQKSILTEKVIVTITPFCLFV